MPSEWIERQIDEVLLTTATTAGLLYARRRARRIFPKVMIGGAVAAVGTVAAAAAAGVVVLGLAAGATAWYRHRSQAASDDGWKAPSPNASASFSRASDRAASASAPPNA
ncbi:MAG TPA: hypothetical protein VKG82_06765 [Solirubrobacteraceae bacterium]|nr:hypothetical protein [Solirubrobacteraceae bacterium]